MVLVKMNQKLRRVQRKFGAKRSGDPDGAVAVLQIAKRLLSERETKSVYACIDEAVDLAAPKDRARAWWAAHRAIRNALPAGYATIREWTDDEETLSADVVDLVDRAAKNQGAVNAAVAKAGVR